jgi:hypothetical protein
MSFDRLIASHLKSIPQDYFGERHNLELVFQKPTGTYTTDSVGNEIAATQAVTFYCTIVDQDKLPLVSGDEGVGYQFLKMVGRIKKYSPCPNGTNPRLLPSWISPQDTATATLIDNANGTRQAGIFKFIATTQHRMTGISEYFGSVIEGELTLNSGV